MAIVQDAEIFDYIGTDDSAEETPIIATLRDGVEAWVKNYCHRDFESTVYTKERYNGTGRNYLMLKQYPVTAISRVAIGANDVLSIKNTNSYTSAIISVSSTGVTYAKDGTGSTLTFVSYATMTALVDAINALGGGWVASLLSSTYANFKSTELIEVYGLSCIDSNTIYLQMPEDAEGDFLVNTETGEIYLPYGTFTRGFRNIIVDYTAGYSTALMPEDLKLAIKLLVKFLYQKRDEDSFGVRRYDIYDIGFSFEDGVMPKEVLAILRRYKRVLI
jgi:hypothetical protein